MLHVPLLVQLLHGCFEPHTPDLIIMWDVAEDSVWPCGSECQHQQQYQDLLRLPPCTEASESKFKP